MDFCVMDLPDLWQRKYTIRAYGVEEISHCSARRWTVDIQTGLFDSSKLNWPPHRREGKVDILLGSEILHLHPTRRELARSLTILNNIYTGNQCTRPDSSQLHANPRATPMFNPLFPRPPLTTAPYVCASLMGSSLSRKCYSANYSTGVTKCPTILWPTVSHNLQNILPM